MNVSDMEVNLKTMGAGFDVVTSLTCKLVTH